MALMILSLFVYVHSPPAVGASQFTSTHYVISPSEAGEKKDFDDIGYSPPPMCSDEWFNLFFIVVCCCG